MTTEVHELPEVGEIVVATITRIGDHGAYATLDEYNNIQGFLHASEIAHGWVPVSYTHLTLPTKA